MYYNCKCNEDESGVRYISDCINNLMSWDIDSDISGNN